MSTAVTNIITTPCKYRRTQVGQIIVPGCCGNNTEIKLFGCSLHNVCSHDHQSENIQACTNCGDYMPQNPKEA